MSFYCPINVNSFSLTLLKGTVFLDFFSLFFIKFILFGLLIQYSYAKEIQKKLNVLQIWAKQLRSFVDTTVSNFVVIQWSQTLFKG